MVVALRDSLSVRSSASRIGFGAIRCKASKTGTENARVSEDTQPARHQLHLTSKCPADVGAREQALGQASEPSATKASHHGLLARLAFETTTISYNRLTSNTALHIMCMAFFVNIMRFAKDTKRSGHARNEVGLAVVLPLERLCGRDT